MCLSEGHFLLYIMIKNNTKKQQSDSTYQSTPIKVAVLVDGGYFIKRYNVLYNTKKNKTPIDIVQDLYYIAHSHVGNNNYLYRIFFYDCEPFAKKASKPIYTKS